MAVELNRLGNATGRFNKRQRHLAEHIAALPRPAGPTATACKRLAEDPAAEHVSEGLEDVGHLVEVVLSAPLQARVAEAVVPRAEVGVGQHFEGPRRFFEASRSLNVAGILVRMKLHREFAISVSDLRRRGSPFDAQHFVVVPLIHHVAP